MKIPNLIPYLSDDLLKPQYKNVANKNKYTGHCYIVCEAIYHLTGKKLKPCVVRHQGGTHWFLKNGEKIIDPTVKQFDKTPPYKMGKGCGFLTKNPSKRAAELIKRYQAS